MNQIVIDIDTPIGNLAITYEGEYLLEVKQVAPQTPPTSNNDPFAREIEEQFHAYFSGDLWEFTLRFNPTNRTNCTGDFRAERVWEQIRKIPYGETCTYGDVAEAIKPGTRHTSGLAVASACKANRLLLIVPCHRVIYAGGGLGGWHQGAVDMKEWLLGHEEKHPTT